MRKRAIEKHGIEWVRSVERQAKDQKVHIKWSPIGAAWPRKDGTGYDVILVAVPADGNMTLRETTHQKQKETPRASSSS